MLKFGKHKDWSVQQIYLIQELVEMMPIAQSLQAPLHLIAGPGRCLSLSSLAALMQVHHCEMATSAAARDALAKSQAIGIDGALSASLIHTLQGLLSSLAGSPAMAMPTVQQQLLGCQTIASHLLQTASQLKTTTQHNEVYLQGVLERLQTQSKMLTSTPGLAHDNSAATAAAEPAGRAAEAECSQSDRSNVMPSAPAEGGIFGLFPAAATAGIAGKLPMFTIPELDLTGSSQKIKKETQLASDFCGVKCKGVSRPC